MRREAVHSAPDTAALFVLRQARRPGQEAGRRAEGLYLRRVRGDRRPDHEDGPGRSRAREEAALVARTAQVVAAVALVALISLCLAWELLLAPLRPGGSLVALKALPLALPLVGIVTGKRYTYQWSSMLILAYVAEGVTRAWSETGMSRNLALAEIALSLTFFVAAVCYARATQARGHP